MPRRKVGKESIRKVLNLSRGTKGVSIPIKIIRELGWKIKQKVVVKKWGKGVMVRDWVKKIT